MTLALNDAQRAAVEHPGGPLLVLAGAGSGKTRVLTARIAHLIRERGVRADRIFAVTFTNKAAEEMRGRVGALLGADPKGLWIGTFHSLGARLLRREAPLLGFGPNYTIYDEEDSEAVLRRMLEQRELSAKTYPPRALHALISGAKNRMVSADQFAADADSALGRVAAECYAELGRVLKQANAMDFDDLLLHPLMLFEAHPERLAWWQQRFDHVLVDEFQDVNAAQYRLVRLLADRHRNLCVVGDDDQAIYGWRGADVRHMLAFREDFPESVIVKLEQNYRSTQVILDVANAVIAENVTRLGKTLFTTQPGGAPAVVCTAADERDEAEWIAGECFRLAADEDHAYEGMAVLYRTNAQSRPLEEAFRFRGIPYRLIGAVSFYERREVKDMLAYLRLIANAADDGAFSRVVNVPRRGLGDASFALLAQTATRWRKPLIDVARAADRVDGLRPNLKDAFRAFAGLLDRLRESVGSADPATALETILAATGYDQALAEEGVDGAERLENVRELIAGAAEWAEVAQATAAPETEEGGEGTLIARYLTQASLLGPTDQATGDPRGVTLLTAHMAKGLEWPVVAIAGMEEGLFPLGRAAGEPGGLEEERRLAYVGLTRARERLYLSWARTRYRYGRMELSQPSRFLEAVPIGAVEERTTTPAWRRSGIGRPAPDRRVVSEFLDIEDTEAERSQDAARYVTGERVRHRKFGAGIVRIVSGTGRSLKVTVDFDDPDIGTKQLLAAYAGLERDGESA
jgi:DNA helicase II / ATP-dependent DNA helicase PcrA